MLPIPWEVNRLPLTAPTKGHILFFAPAAALFRLIGLLRQIPENSPGLERQPAWQGSWVTTTNRTSNAIVWVVGAGGDQRSYGYNGDTGAVVYAGRGSNELMANTRKWNTGIVARGRIYFAADNKVYAFAVP
jgi:hypothetical protein